MNPQTILENPIDLDMIEVNDFTWKALESSVAALELYESDNYITSAEGSIEREILDYQANFLMGEISLEGASKNPINRAWESIKGRVSEVFKDINDNSDMRVGLWLGVVQSRLNGVREHVTKHGVTTITVDDYVLSTKRKYTKGEFSNLASDWEFIILHSSIMGEMSKKGAKGVSSRIFGNSLVTVDSKDVSIKVTEMKEPREGRTDYTTDQIALFGSTLSNMIHEYQSAHTHAKAIVEELGETEGSRKMITDADLSKFEDEYRSTLFKLRLQGIIIPLMVKEFDRVSLKVIAQG